MPPCLCALVLLAGCTLGGGGDPRGPLEVTVANAANTTHRFDVSVVDGRVDDRDIVVRFRNRSDDAVSLDEGLSTYKLVGYGNYATAVELPANRTREYGRYSLEPNESTSLTLDDSERESTVVVVVSRGEQAVSLVSVHCGGGPIQYLDVTMRPYGTDSATYCL